MRFIMLNEEDKQSLSDATGETLKCFDEGEDAMLVVNVVKAMFDELEEHKVFQIPVYEKTKKIEVFSTYITIPYQEDRALICSLIFFILKITHTVSTHKEINMKLIKKKLKKFEI